MKSKIWKKIAAILTIGLFLPSLIIFILEITIGRTGPIESISSIISRQFSEGDNLFLLALWGLIPFAVLSLIVGIKRKKWSDKKVNFTILIGMVGILVIMIPAHWSIWEPLYTNDHTSSTAVVTFIFIPFVCLISMLIFLGIGKVVEIVASRNNKV